jgi:hypothetical protein
VYFRVEPNYTLGCSIQLRAWTQTMLVNLRQFSGYTTRLRSLSQQTKALLVFAIAYLLTYQYLRAIAAADPSSALSDPARIYERRYSELRIREADDFIAKVQDGQTRGKASADPSICVGIATVQRESARYFYTLVGSLLDGLTEGERSDILLLPFIANVNPNDHQAFREHWLRILSDDVLTYESVSAEDRTRLRFMETPTGHKEKALFDYSYMLRGCLNTTAPYFLLLEDDVLASDGWYPRTKAALKDLESRRQYTNSVYLRLFFNTRIQGWNSESWPYYLVSSLAFEILLIGALYFLRKRSNTAATFLTPYATICILFVCTPACIGLYFAAGRLIVQPYSQGIHQMNSYGCCSQAFIFPRNQVPPLLDYFAEQKTGMRDVLIEKYADKHGLTRWASTPSVFQHVGARSSKWGGPGSDMPDANGRINTQRIWNHQFELWDASTLWSEREARSRLDAS